MRSFGPATARRSTGPSRSRPTGWSRTSSTCITGPTGSAGDTRSWSRSRAPGSRSSTATRRPTCPTSIAQGDRLPPGHPARLPDRPLPDGHRIDGAAGLRRRARRGRRAALFLSGCRVIGARPAPFLRRLRHEGRRRWAALCSAPSYRRSGVMGASPWAVARREIPRAIPA